MKAVVYYKSPPLMMPLRASTPDYGTRMREVMESNQRLEELSQKLKRENRRLEVQNDALRFSLKNVAENLKAGWNGKMTAQYIYALLECK